MFKRLLQLVLPLSQIKTGQVNAIQTNLRELLLTLNPVIPERFYPDLEKWIFEEEGLAFEQICYLLINYQIPIPVQIHRKIEEIARQFQLQIKDLELLQVQIVSDIQWNKFTSIPKPYFEIRILLIDRIEQLNGEFYSLFEQLHLPRNVYRDLNYFLNAGEQALAFEYLCEYLITYPGSISTQACISLHTFGKQFGSQEKLNLLC